MLSCLHVLRQPDLLGMSVRVLLPRSTRNSSLEKNTSATSTRKVAYAAPS